MPALVSSLAAIGLANLFLDRGLLWPVSAIAAAGALVGVLYSVGLAGLRRKPYLAAYLMESGLLLLTIGAGVAGALLVVFAIDNQPSPTAPVRDQELFAALFAALASYLGGLIINPKGDRWNPVKDAIKRTFGNDFTRKRDSIEEDARDAVKKDMPYGAKSGGEKVNGWDWNDRRMRSRQLQRAVDKGYLAS